jgi:GNAT superfamily N-acetyltransferase
LVALRPVSVAIEAPILDRAAGQSFGRAPNHRASAVVLRLHLDRMDTTAACEGLLDGGHEIVLVGTEHVPSVAALLADAFEVDAAYQYLFPAPATRRIGLTDFFTRNLRTHLAHACTYAMTGPRGVCATATLRPPGGIHISTLTMLRQGLLPFALAHGLSAVKRLFWLKHTYDALEAKAAHNQPHWYVHMMGVQPDLQGRGLGSQLLERTLSQTADTNPRAPAVLTTHLPRNLVFYRRAGFELTDERVLRPPDGAPYTVWSMARPSAWR